MDKATNFKWILDKLGGISKEDIKNNTVGDVLEKNRGFEDPHPLVPPQLGYEPWQLLEQIGRVMDTMGRTTEVTRGVSPKNVRSNAQLENLMRQDQNPLIPAVRSFELGECEAAKLKVLLARDWYDDDRKVRILGENNRIHVISFNKAMIKDEMDIIVEPDSGMPRSRNEMKEQVMKLVEFGLIDPANPPTRRAIHEIWQFHTFDKIFEVENKARNRALMEHQAIANLDPIKYEGNQEMTLEAVLSGKLQLPIHALECEPHPIHIEEHEEFLMGDEYLKWTPEQQQLLQMHIEHHYALWKVKLEKGAEFYQLLVAAKEGNQAANQMASTPAFGQ
jgi:hypothetical protein